MSPRRGGGGGLFEGGAYLKLGANSSIYGTSLPALGTGQAVGWSRVCHFKFVLLNLLAQTSTEMLICLPECNTMMSHRPAHAL